MENITIRQISPSEVPMEFVYDADESRESVADYISRGEIYAAQSNGNIIGEYITSYKAVNRRDREYCGRGRLPQEGYR